MSINNEKLILAELKRIIEEYATSFDKVGYFPSQLEEAKKLGKSKVILIGCDSDTWETRAGGCSFNDLSVQLYLYFTEKNVKNKEEPFINSLDLVDEVRNAIFAENCFLNNIGGAQVVNLETIERGNYVNTDVDYSIANNYSGFRVVVINLTITYYHNIHN